jgi:hypothetical protein
MCSPAAVRTRPVYGLGLPIVGAMAKRGVIRGNWGEVIRWGRWTTGCDAVLESPGRNGLGCRAEAEADVRFNHVPRSV